MNDLKVFSNTEFGELGVMVIDGKEYFPATQCAKLLGYAKPADAIRNHCKGVFKTETPTNGGIQKVNYIPEGDLYRLIVSSKLPAAEKFERWVFDEVLPSIRKNGGYGDIDIQSIIAQTAAAAVGEVMKQIMPIITGTSENADKGSGKDMMWEVKVPKKRKPTGVIIRLAPELRRTVDDMLLSGCTYNEVKSYLANNNIGLSIQAICNYYNEYLS